MTANDGERHRPRRTPLADRRSRLLLGSGVVLVLTAGGLQLLGRARATIMAWKDFAAAPPRGDVLSRETGFRRAYGSNPYVGYDDVNKPPFLFRGPTDDRLPPMERVLTVEVTDPGIGAA